MDAPKCGVKIKFLVPNKGLPFGGSSTNTFKIIIIILFVVFYFNRKKIYNQITI